jgi:alkylation response protein AidB-like acyl-CoA dehydrogenase
MTSEKAMSLLGRLVLEYELPFFTDEHKLLRKNVREFAEKEVVPHARKIDTTNEYPRWLLPKLAEQGLLGMNIPSEYGGSKLDSIGVVVAMEELARASGSVALIVGIQGGMAVFPILYYGNEEQKKRYLPRLAKGEIIGAFALTEPCCGSDAASLQLRAERERDGFTLTGRKTYITQGAYADLFVVFARTGRPEDKHRGVTAFIFEKKEKGCPEVFPLEPMGFRGTGTAELKFDNCFVPSENVLGKEGRGFEVAMFTLDEGRIGASAVAIGLATAALEEAYSWTLQREAFGRPIHQFEAVRFQIVDMAVELEAMRLLAYTAAYIKDRGDRRYIWLASAAKLYAGIKANEIASTAVRILGGLGYIKESNVERIYRDAKLLEIGEGTNEVQRWIMGKVLYNELFV